MSFVTGNIGKKKDEKERLMISISEDKHARGPK